ncbi:MAG: ABC transporter substrate-binding protein [Chloroflexi bacterium]|nr:ABC transporter substrate-binding protein [Chloroflexota bacterium]
MIGSVLRLGMMFLLLSLFTLLACARAAPTVTPTAAPAVAPTTTPTTAPAVAPVATPTRALTVISTPTRAAPTPTPTAAPAVKRRPTGVLTPVVSGFESERWVLRYTSGFEEGLMSPMTESLLFADPVTLGYLPGLATEWKVVVKPDGKVDWVFKLRKGVKFHDGRGEMKAEDVKASLTDYQKPGSIATFAADFVKWYGKDPKNIEILGDYDLVIHSPEVMTEVEDSLLTEFRGLKVFPKSYMEQVGEDGFARKPVFTGPFEFLEHKRSQSLRYKALEEHWRVVPEFAELNILMVPESSTQMALLRTGKADIIRLDFKLKPEAVAAGLRLSRLERQRAYEGWFGGLWLKSHPNYDPTVPWAGQDPLDSKPLAVRQAMNLAIDRQAIVDKILLGEGEVTNVAGWVYTPGAAWTSPDLKPYFYDPKKAKELLAQAGYPAGFSFGFWFMPPTDRLAVAEAVASYWEAIGLKPNRAIVEYRPTVRQKIIDRKTGGWVYELGNTTGRTFWGHGCTVGGLSTTAIHHQEHPFMDQACTKMRGEADFNKRVSIARELGEWINKNYWMWPVSFAHELFALSPRVEWSTTVSTGGSVTNSLEYAKHAQ